MKRAAIFLLIVFLSTSTLFAENLSLKSARQTSTYYAFAVGIAETLNKHASGSNVTVETSAGSVENVKMARMRQNFLFTSPPSLVQEAINAGGQFSEGGYEAIRSLWPIPGLVMHWVVRKDSGVKSLEELAGKRCITRAVLESKGIYNDINLLTVDLSEGVRAVRNRRAVGFGTSSTPPASMVQEIASTIDVRILELSDADFAKVSDQYTRTVIPAGLYKGVDQDVDTISLPVALYSTKKLSEDTAYKLTKAFWENRSEWEGTHPAMKLINMQDVNSMKARLHPGALRYYREIGFDVNPGMR